MAWKWVLSFRKDDWEFADYPVVVREQKFDSAFSAKRFTQHRYWAHVLGWLISAGGNAKQEALAALAEAYKTQKKYRLDQRTPLPRPGADIELLFASQYHVKTHPELTEDFIQRVLQLEEAWVSDESSLWDFHVEESNALLEDRIREVYGVDVSDIKSGNLAQILDRIAAHRAGQQAGQ